MKGRNAGLITALCVLTLSLGCGLRGQGLEPGAVTSAGGSDGTESGGTGGTDPTGGVGGDPGTSGVGGDVGAGGSAPGTGGSAPGTGGSAPGTGGSAPGTGGTPSDSGAAGASPDSGTAGASPDSGAAGDPVDLPADAGAAPDLMPDAAPPAVTAGSIECGSLRCDVDTQICCMGAAGASTCARKDVGCAVTMTPRSCDGPEDCDGERVCCANGQVLVGGFRSACSKPSECTNNGGAPICRGRSDCFGTFKTCEPTDFSGTHLSTCAR
jgi:hypothetical protein